MAGDRTNRTNAGASTVLYDGTQAATSSAAALNGGTSQRCTEVLVQNDPGSAGDLLVGNGTSQSIRLAAGVAEALQVANVNMVYIKRQASGSAATCNWHARR